MKLKTLALAALLASSLPAFATVKSGLNTTELGQSEFVLLVTNAAGSYAQDLGISVNDMHALLSTTGSFTQSVAGAQWNAFQAFGGTNSTYAIISVASLGDGYFAGETNVWTTVAAGQVLGTFQNIQVTDTSGALAFHFADIDNRAVNTGIGQENNRVASAFGLQSYSDNITVALNGNGFRTANAIGQSTSMVYMTPATDVTDEPASATILTNTSNSAYVVNFDGNNVTFTAAVTAVPEPSTYAMLAAGLAAVGFVARRRKAA